MADELIEQKSPLGAQELALLRYVSDHAPVSVRTAATNYGMANGLARTTVLTMMERLRQKNYLTRAKDSGAFVYSPSVGKPQLLNSLVGDFVRKTLGGSVSPFVAYLADAPNLSAGEVAELRRLVERMEDKTDSKNE